MPRGKRVSEELKEIIRHEKLSTPDITHRELAHKHGLSRVTVTKILNHQVIKVIKNMKKYKQELGEITKVDDLLLILSDTIFKIQYDELDCTQARTVGYLVNVYFSILEKRDRVKKDGKEKIKDYFDLLTTEELEDLAKRSKETD